MLVITRKRGQSFRVGENIMIHIIETDRGNVKVGIDAPKDVPIARSELLGRETKHKRSNP